MKRIALLAALTLTGCTAQATPSAVPSVPSTPRPTTLAGNAFEAVEVTENGARRTLVPGTKLRMRFGADGTLVADAGCNQIEATVTIGADRLDVGEFRTTAMSCPGARDEQDDWLTAFLADPSWRRDGAGFVLEPGTIDVGTVELSAERPGTGSGDTDQRAVLDVLRYGQKLTYSFDDNGALRILAGDQGLLLDAR